MAFIHQWSKIFSTAYPYDPLKNHNPASQDLTVSIFVSTPRMTNIDPRVTDTKIIYIGTITIPPGIHLSPPDNYTPTYTYIVTLYHMNPS